MRTRTLVIGSFLGCGFLLFVCVIACGGFFFYLYNSTDKEITPQVDVLFAAIDNDTFGDTYATETTPEMRQTISKEAYAQLGRTIKNRLGKLQSKTLIIWNSRQFNAETSTNVVYTAVFEKGTGAIQAGFKKIDGHWRLLSFRVESPELSKDLPSAICPHCGKPCTPEAKFCPSCGKAIAEVEEKEPAVDVEKKDAE